MEDLEKQIEELQRQLEEEKKAKAEAEAEAEEKAKAEAEEKAKAEADAKKEDNLILDIKKQYEEKISNLSKKFEEEKKQKDNVIKQLLNSDTANEEKDAFDKINEKRNFRKW